MSGRAEVQPFPGSDQAIEHGCKCPVLDNGHGNPALARDRGGWVINFGCPLHAPAPASVVPRPDEEDAK